MKRSQSHDSPYGCQKKLGYRYASSANMIFCTSTFRTLVLTFSSKPNNFVMPVRPLGQATSEVKTLEVEARKFEKFKSFTVVLTWINKFKKRLFLLTINLISDLFFP